MALTAEQKRERLQQMQQDGSKADDFRSRRVADKSKSGGGADGGDDDKGTGSGNPNFLSEMQRDVYLNDSSVANMEDRLKRNRHYQQRGADSANFMKR